MTREAKHLVAGYATDSLDEAERRELLRAALDDQALFDTLVEEDGLRELLQDPAARQEVLAALEEPRGWERVLAWFERPATLLDLGAIATLVFVALAGYALLGVRPTPSTSTPAAARPMGVALSPQHIAWLFELPEQQVALAGLEIAMRPDTVLAPGEPLHLRVSLRAPARVALLEQQGDRPGNQAWPGLGQPPALVPRPSSGGPAIHELSLETPAEAGSHRLRLVVAPAELDLGALAPESLPGVAHQLTIVDLRYQVTQR
jgi:hypothetical protein